MSVEWVTLDTNILVYSIDKVAMPAVQQHHLSFWDAMLWAVAQQAGVTLLLSEDCQHNRMLEEMRFYNPFLEKEFNLDLI